MVSKCMSSFPSGSVERIDVPDPNAESLWHREIGGTLQRGHRPAPRNQTSEAPLPLQQCDCMIMICQTDQLNPLSCTPCFQHLKQQQEGLSHLISVIKDDLEDIKLIEHGLCDSGHLRGGILS